MRLPCEIAPPRLTTRGQTPILVRNRVTTPKIKIRRVAVEKILPLRHKILRAGMPPESARFDGDEAGTTIHLAALTVDDAGHAAGEVIGCLSLMLNSFNAEPAWQLRGMAVDETHQRLGVGRELMTRAEEAVAAEGKAGWLWCNARTPAAAFYQKQGWAIVSEDFEIPTAGPHVKMSKKLNCPKPPETVEKRRGKR
jgi:GNAT superfamily N-acetyltransferase